MNEALQKRTSILTVVESNFATMLAYLLALHACLAEAESQQTLALDETERNLIMNGDFAKGDAPWAADDVQDPPLCNVLLELAKVVENVSPILHEMWLNCRVRRILRDGKLCVTITNYRPVFFGPKQEFSLDAGRRYRLSFGVSASAPVQIVAKVGHSVDPWTPAFQQWIPAEPRFATFSETIEPLADDKRAGLVFMLRTEEETSHSDVCFDDVSLQLD